MSDADDHESTTAPYEARPPAPARRFSPTEILQGAGAAAGTTALVYVVGGMVMWLRFRKAGLPPDHAVALMERQQLLVIGLRLMVLPAALTGALAWWLIRRRRADAAWRAERAHWTRTALKTAVIAFAAIFALMLPFSFASVTWVIAATAVVGYLRYERRPAGDRPDTVSPAARAAPGGGPSNLPRRAREALRRLPAFARRRSAALAPYIPFRRRHGSKASPLIVTMLVVVVAAVVSLGRQLDQPVQLLSATVTLNDAKTPVEGQYIGSDSNEVFLGVDKQITAIPRSTIRDVTLGPPHDLAPHQSVASVALGPLLHHNRFAITPFEWWCNGQRYSWGDAGDLCKTQPRLLDNSIDLVGDRAAGFHIPVKLLCPQEANDTCRGFLRLATKGRYQVGSALPGPAAFHTPLRRAGAPESAPPGIAPSHAAIVCVPVDVHQRGLLRKRRAVGEPKLKKTIPFNLTISADQAGRNVLRRATFYVNITDTPSQSECSKQPAAAVRTRVSCEATKRGKKQTPRFEIACTLASNKRLSGLVTVAVTRADKVYAQDAAIADGRKLTLHPAPTRRLTPGSYSASVVLGGKSAAAQTFRAPIKLR